MTLAAQALTKRPTSRSGEALRPMMSPALTDDSISSTEGGYHRLCLPILSFHALSIRTSRSGEAQPMVGTGAIDNRFHIAKGARLIAHALWS